MAVTLLVEVMLLDVVGNFMLEIQKDYYPPVIKRVSDCWGFYAVSTARVIFMAKLSLDVFNL